MGFESLFKSHFLYTCLIAGLFNHFPRMRRIRNNIPRAVSSVAIANHTPFSPYLEANAYAIVRRMHHIVHKFMSTGLMVSPAPTQTL